MQDLHFASGEENNQHQVNGFLYLTHTFLICFITEWPDPVNQNTEYSSNDDTPLQHKHSLDRIGAWPCKLSFAIYVVLVITHNRRFDNGIL